MRAMAALATIVTLLHTVGHELYAFKAKPEAQILLVCPVRNVIEAVRTCLAGGERAEGSMAPEDL